MLNYRKYKKLIKSILLVLLVILFIYIYTKVNTIKNIINIISIGFILAYSIKPFRDNICEKFNISKKLSSVIIVSSIIAIIMFICYKIVPSLIRESYNIGYIVDNIDDYVMGLAEKLNLSDISFFQTLYFEISEEVNIFFNNLTSNFLDNILNIFESLVSLAIIPIVTYYFLADGELIYNKLLLILPTEKRIITKKTISHIDKVLCRYIISQILLSFIIGVITFIVLIFLGIKFSLILAIFNGILNIVPYFGPIIGGIPAIFVALMQSPNKALLTLVAIFIIQQIEGNILSPKITGDSTNMHPIVIIILLLLGERLGGFIGMILAVPIGVIIKVVYDEINDYLF